MEKDGVVGLDLNNNIEYKMEELKNGWIYTDRRI